MAFKSASQGAPSPILPCDTFADIPFDPITGAFIPNGTFGNYQAGQMFLTLDDNNVYMVVQDGSNGLTLVHQAGFLLFGTVGISAPPLSPIPRGFLVSQDLATGLYVTNGFAGSTQALTLRSTVAGLIVPVLTSGIGLIVVANGATIRPSENITANDGFAVPGAANQVAISVDSASRTGNAGGTVLVKAQLRPVGN